MKNNIEQIYDDNSVSIHGETFDKDFDDVKWEPDVEDDSDEEAKELYGL